MDKRQEHFLKLYQPVHDRFERFCRARVYRVMDHRDLMNDTLLVAYKKFESLDSDRAFLSFLCGIAIRILANERRKQKEAPWHEGLDDIPGSMQSDTTAEVHLLHHGLSKLPEAQRESLILFEIVGFSIKEIAGMHDVSQAVVRQRLVRGRKKLAKVLAPEYTFTQKEKAS